MLPTVELVAAARTCRKGRSDEVLPLVGGDLWTFASLERPGVPGACRHLEWRLQLAEHLLALELARGLIALEGSQEAGSVERTGRMATHGNGEMVKAHSPALPARTRSTGPVVRSCPRLGVVLRTGLTIYGGATWGLSRSSCALPAYAR